MTNLYQFLAAVHQPPPTVECPRDEVGDDKRSYDEEQGCMKIMDSIGIGAGLLCDIVFICHINI